MIFVAPYSAAIGCLYLMGYWGAFGINIFQFAGVTDVVASSILPLLIVALGSGFAFAIGNVPASWVSERLLNRPPSIKFHRHMEKYGDVYFRLFIAANVIVGALLLTSDFRFRWAFIPATIAIPLGMIFLRSGVVLFPDLSYKVQFMTLGCVLALLPTAFGTGATIGDSVRLGKAFYYVLSSSDAALLPKGRVAKNGIRYIGHVGDFDFFL